MTAQYILVERQQHPSKLTPGAQCYRFTWYGLRDGLLWEMTTDPGFRNWQRQGWRLLCEEPDPWGVYEGLRTTARQTRSGMPIITADSRPDRIYHCRDHAEALELVTAHQRELHGNPAQALWEFS